MTHIQGVNLTDEVLWIASCLWDGEDGTKRKRTTSEGLCNFLSVALQQLIDKNVGFESDNDSLPFRNVQYNNKQVKQDTEEYLAR